jgi:Uri superfamily endonuclease
VDHFTCYAKRSFCDRFEIVESHVDSRLEPRSARDVALCRVEGSYVYVGSREATEKLTGRVERDIGKMT